nr:endonuclease [Arsenophonus endosymbiont of Aleurodicus floccissimus]
MDFKNSIFEPRNEVKGQVARVMFYMYDRYNLTMSKQQQQLLMAWDRQFPVNRWEKLQNERIGKITGHYNPFFVTGELTWQLGHRNQAAGLSVATTEIEKNQLKQKVIFLLWRAIILLLRLKVIKLAKYTTFLTVRDIRFYQPKIVLFLKMSRPLLLRVID